MYYSFVIYTLSFIQISDLSWATIRAILPVLNINTAQAYARRIFAVAQHQRKINSLFLMLN